MARLTLELREPNAFPDPGWVEAEDAHHRLRCLCGRFAKWGGDRHYYNGWFDCYSFDVICSKHGTVTIECV